MQKILYVLLIFYVGFGKVSAQPIKVEIIKNETGYQILRGGKPYVIKGAGGTDYLEKLAAYGGNSIRTWGTQNAKSILDAAQKNGLTVMLGLNVVPERHGFNYDDADAVKKQLERVREDILKYKDHPALLTWGIGNELNLHYKNPKVWEAVNEIALMIKALDKNHLVTTVLAGAGKSEISLIKKNLPAIDLIAVNTYGGLANLPKQIKNAGWDGPYIVTEWGPTGHWEGLTTTWNAPIEETSSEKAAVYKSRYLYGIDKDKQNCLGSYVFLWGQKQERTPTWYGLFTAKGQESEVIDVMQYLWSGKYPNNKAPHIYSLTLNNQKVVESVVLKTKANYQAKVDAIDPENTTLKYQWELLPEATKVGEGGDYEDKPLALNVKFINIKNGEISFETPAITGAYRLFVYVIDDQNKVATANFPFYVK